MSRLSPFEFIGSINDKKYLMVTPEVERQYVPFIVNRGLSNFIDAMPYVHFLNQHPNLPNKMQYDYLYYGLRKMKRFGGKWAKLEKHEYLDDVIAFYKVSKQKAMGLIERLSEEQLVELRARTKRIGGVISTVNTP